MFVPRSTEAIGHGLDVPRSDMGTRARFRCAECSGSAGRTRTRVRDIYERVLALVRRNVRRTARPYACGRVAFSHGVVVRRTSWS